jgi:hypothetical protein
MLPERWIAVPPWVRCLSLVAICGAALLIAEIMIAQPRHRQADELALNNHRESQKNVILRHSLLSLMAANRQVEKPSDTLSAERFSAMAFIHRAGGKVEKWLPESKPAGLEAAVRWERLPELFTHLSRYRSVSLKGFSVEPRGDLLRLNLMLEISDEA